MITFTAFFGFDCPSSSQNGRFERAQKVKDDDVVDYNMKCPNLNIGACAAVDRAVHAHPVQRHAQSHTRCGITAGSMRRPARNKVRCNREAVTVTLLHMNEFQNDRH